MLELFRSKKSAPKEEVAELLAQMLQKIDLRFNELSAQVRDLELGLQQMETRLLTKDLKDKQQYGILHYKLHEKENRALKEEIETLDSALKLRKGLQRDQ
jgi:hypothetical protein